MSGYPRCGGMTKKSKYRGSFDSMGRAIARPISLRMTASAGSALLAGYLWDLAWVKRLAISSQLTTFHQAAR